MNTYKILIVDDESIEREAIQFILSKQTRHTFEFFEAINGQEAISSVAVNSPDIIMMDIRMPGLNGIEATRIIKKILPECKIIFLTAYNEFDYAHEAIKLGVIDFVVKPATNERLFEVIDKTIEAIEIDKEAKLHRENIETKLEQVSKYLEQEFLSSVINGDMDEVQGKEFLDFSGIQYNSGLGIVISTKVDASEIQSTLRIQMLRKRFLEKLKVKLTGMVSYTLATIIKEYIFILVIGSSDDELMHIQQKLREAIIETSDLFAQQHQLYTDFGIGDQCHRLDCLWKSFSTAKSYCNKSLKNQDVQRKHFFIGLVKSILDQDDANFSQSIELVFEDLSTQAETIDQLKIKLYELCIRLRNEIAEKISDKEVDSYDIYNHIMKITNQQEAKHLLREYCHLFMMKLVSIKTDKTKVILNKLIMYINSHYAENLTLEQLSTLCSLSPTYISKIFKTQLDTNFIDYVSSVRIKVAKRLIKNSELSLKEISNEIGYIDPNYFTRVFKKYEGMTPSEYRNDYYGFQREESGLDEHEV